MGLPVLGVGTGPPIVTWLIFHIPRYEYEVPMSSPVTLAVGLCVHVCVCMLRFVVSVCELVSKNVKEIQLDSTTTEAYTARSAFLDFATLQWIRMGGLLP